MTSFPWGCGGFEVAGTCIPSASILVASSLAVFAWVAWSKHRRSSA